MPAKEVVMSFITPSLDPEFLSLILTVNFIVLHGHDCHLATVKRVMFAHVTCEV